MQHLIKLILTGFFSFLLFACTTTTTDPETGKADFAAFKQWAEEAKIVDKSFEQKITELAYTPSDKRDNERLKKLVKTQIDEQAKKLKALRIRHTDVLELQNKTLAILAELRLGTLAFLELEQNPQYRPTQAESIAFVKEEQLMDEAQILYRRLQKQFDSEIQQ